MNPSNDDSLIDEALRRVSQGETAAFEEILRRFERPLRAWLAAHVPLGGSDVVFFDLQTFVNPSEGDAFHVSPLAFRDGLTSHPK